LETIGAELPKEWMEVDKKQLYKAGWDKREGKQFFFWGVGEAKFWFCLLGSMAFVWI
jgi:hypothetical protein